jgi:membrane-associated phospholipid phosphatase
VLAWAAVTVAARPSPLERVWTARWPLYAEIALFLVLNFTYEWLRDLVAVDDPTRPIRHALDVVSLEKDLGVFVEVDVHDWAQRIPAVDFTTTWIYTLEYTSVMVGMFLAIWFLRRDRFPFFRNWYWLTNGLAVVGYWLYPLAPPRLTDLGLSDPTREALQLGGSLSWFQPFRNEFAAMPSMHVGSAFLFALVAFWLLAPRRGRWLTFLWPALILFTVVATANHWLLDGVAGVTTVLIALVIVLRLTPGQRRPWERAPA